MNNISLYIQEKLKIKSNTKIDLHDNNHLFRLLDDLVSMNESAVIFEDELITQQYHIDKLTVSFDENTGYITLNKIIIEDKNKGYGTMFMQDLCEWCDKNNRILTLTPSTDFGSSKGRLKSFYKSFAFKENRGKKSNFNTRDSMIRYPLK